MRLAVAAPFLAITLALASCRQAAEPPSRPILPPAPPGACSGPRPSADAICARECGPPVPREGDPEPGYLWLSGEEAESRARFGCPICMPEDTRVATPSGEVRIDALTVGMIVWTLDGRGHRVAAPVLHIGSTRAPSAHRLVHLVLDDGREVSASPGHPLADGRTFASVAVGDAVDGARVVSAARVPYTHERTWDLVVASPTGAYFADGLPVGSTLGPR